MWSSREWSWLDDSQNTFHAHVAVARSVVASRGNKRSTHHMRSQIRQLCPLHAQHRKPSMGLSRHEGSKHWIQHRRSFWNSTYLKPHLFLASLRSWWCCDGEWCTLANQPGWERRLWYHLRQCNVSYISRCQISNSLKILCEYKHQDGAELGADSRCIKAGWSQRWKPLWSDCKRWNLLCVRLLGG